MKYKRGMHRQITLTKEVLQRRFLNNGKNVGYPSTRICPGNAQRLFYILLTLYERKGHTCNVKFFFLLFETVLDDQPPSRTGISRSV